MCCCVCVCGTALHWAVAAAVSGSSRTAVVVMHGSSRIGCGAVSRRVELLHFRRVVAVLRRYACVVVRVVVVVVVVCVCVRMCACDARRCVSSKSLLSNIVVLRFCMCIPCCIHSVFAGAVLLLCVERLFERAWRRCRRVVTCASVAISLACIVDDGVR
jgi:hypothetical protein